MQTPDRKKVKIDETPTNSAHQEQQQPQLQAASNPEINWQEPTKAHGMRWQGFLMSDVRGDSSNRRSAKCKYCDEEFSNGKPSVLFKHIKMMCPSVPDSNKTEYIKITSEENQQQQAQQAQQQEHSTQPSSSRKRKVKSEPPQEQQQPQPPQPTPPKEYERLHELLFKSIIKSNSSFSLLDEPNFQAYQIGLSPKGYLIPNSNQFIKVTIPLIYAKHQIESINKLQNLQHLSLSIDHFTLHQNHQFGYAIIIHSSEFQINQLIEVLHFSPQTHSSQNLFNSIKQTLDAKSLSLDQFDGLVSDHSNPIIQELINLFKFEYSHILHLNSSIHLITSISKLILSHPFIQPIIDSNQILYDFFTNSAHWNHYLINFNQPNPNLQAGSFQFTSQTNPSWYSIIKISSWVHTYQLALQHASTLSSIDPNPILQPHQHQLPNHIQTLIQDTNHLILNETLNEIISPLLETFNRIKSTHFQISNLWSELISLLQSFTHRCQKLSNHVDFLEFNLNSIKLIEELSLKVLKEDEVYLIGFFLTPKFKTLSVSKKFGLDDLLRSVLKIVKVWKFNKLEAILIKELLTDYYHQESKMKAGESSYTYWTQQDPSLLKTLSLRLLNLIPNTYPIQETLSSQITFSIPDPSLQKMIQQLIYSTDFQSIPSSFDQNRFTNLDPITVYQHFKLIDSKLTNLNDRFMDWFDLDAWKDLIPQDDLLGLGNDILVDQIGMTGNVNHEIWDIEDLL
ncbi:uncharacterized protein MELLADRAFT_66320 [Melampsora larici-populina 98AG31]|uniref:BED-type domain-containing protein n=1 Tax=Melampsora larici-populina (strain 98AG31 / pathotype 3-4-7) TaxID=747676 RepID=F4RYQ4_MELLP|nr:uncharacterized protein MELLADRAFT_66320 [Melampsora larici-populina 98AG31]EGG02510.1 hypothetical protein MELLADRAFT_66320 [Melampsora larici-populina 98AG31]